MKRVISIILCLTMLFVMASVPALAADGGNWITLLDEDFGSYPENDKSFNVKTPAVEYENATAYIYSPDSPSDKVSYTVNAYEGNNALKISKTEAGDKRILFKLNEARSGQVEISFKMLFTGIVNKGVNVEVYNEDRTTIITGTRIELSKGNVLTKTHYNSASTLLSSTTNWLTANTWLSVKYVINTTTGVVDATYTDGTNTATKQGNSASSLPAVSGIVFRTSSADTNSLHVDDIKIKYLEQPAAAESEFEFKDFKGENVSEAEVTKALKLPSTYTDSTLAQWNITWASSNSAVIDAATGAVNPAEVDKEVTLTATFTGTKKTFTKEFTLTVPALLSEFDFSVIANGNKSVNTVTGQLRLPTEFTDNSGRVWAITWNSGNEAVIDAQTGEVTQGGIDERVTLTAALTYYGDGTEGELTLSRSFNVKVLAAGTYHINEGFDASADYSGHNAIKNYTGPYNLTWTVVDNYGTDTSGKPDMNANISTDPENSADKVLKLYRKGDPTNEIQRIQTTMNSNASELNDKVYVGMRMLREEGEAPTYIYVYDTAGTRLMYFQFVSDNSIRYTYNASHEMDTSAVTAPLGEWFDITIELDMKNSLYNAYVDGVSVTSGSRPMAASEDSQGFGGLMFDLPRNKAGYTMASTTYIDDLTVRTTDGFPYSIAEYNFTDAQGYPTKSMVEGGKLKSVNMRKMSTVDSESEPELYLGFFKGEKLYDVVCAPLSDYSALGGFEVVLNEALPANPLDYTVKAFVFSKDLVPLMNSSEYTPIEVNPTIFVAGDSIGAYRSAAQYPQSGYAQELVAFFEDDTVNIDNHAISGRSSKSFYDEGSLDKILDKMYSGDYLFIQFGHNDEDGKGEYRETDPKGATETEGSYKNYLMKYIDGAKAKGATPVLITPPARNEFGDDGKMYDDRLLPYVEAMRELATAENVLLVDLYAGWSAFVDGEVEKGIDSKNFYAYFYPSDPRFINEAAWTASDYSVTSGTKYEELYKWYVVNPDDANDTSKHVHHDGTHLNIYGARVAAKIIADRLAQLDIGIKDNILENTSVEWTFGDYATFGEVKAR